ncbi:MAG: DUF4339 domain-containing protein [Myxococcota bacterium]
MSWYLNRGGQQEGPLEEAQILQMIQSGQLTDGHVAQAGSNQWVPLRQVPQFAQALDGFGAAAAGTGFGAAGPGPMGGGGPPAKKKSPMGLILGLVGLLAVVGGGVGLYFLFFAGASSKLSASVPEDTQIFFEIPSAPAALRDFATMDIVDRDELEAEATVDKIQEGLEEAFELNQEEAEALLTNLESIAVAARALDGDEGPEAVFLLSFGDAAPVETLLGTDRFEELDDVAGGKRYAVERVDVDYEEMKDWSGPRRSFSTMSFKEDSERDAFVWFADAKLLAIGHPDIIEDVGHVAIDGDPSLQGGEKWKGTEFASDASALLYIDSELAEEIDEKELEKFVEGYLDGVAPIGATMAFASAGMVITLQGELRGDKVTDDDYAAPVAIDIQDHLPQETFAYIAMSTKSDLSGEEAKDRMLKEFEDLDEDDAKDFEEALDKIEDELDLKLEDVLDALGDQIAFAVAAESGFEFDPKTSPTDLIGELGFGIVVAVEDEEKAKDLVATLREKAFEDGPLEKMYELEDVGEGFDAEPERDEAPEIRVRLENGFFLLAGGGLAEAFTRALGKEETLADVAAHQRAMKALGGKPYGIYWEDTGRMAATMLEYVDGEDRLQKQLEEAEESAGIKTDAFRFEGDNRMTSAAGISLDIGSDRWGYRISALNMPMVSIGAMAAVMRFGGPSMPPPPADDGPSADGIPSECQAYFKLVENCAKVPEATRDAVKTMRESMDKLKGTAEAMKSMASSCESGRKAMAMLCN